MKWTGAAIAALAMLAANGSMAHAQTDAAISGFRTFNTSTTGNGTVQTPSDSFGGMLELRHIQSPFIGYELTYSLSQADQSFAPEPGACGFYCSTQPVSVSAKMHEVALDWVVSKQMGSLKPFAVGGVGFAIAEPGHYPALDLTTVVKPAYVYGGGVDWAAGGRMGVRAQVRGNAYKAEQMDRDLPPTGRFTETIEPMVGVYFRL